MINAHQASLSITMLDGLQNANMTKSIFICLALFVFGCKQKDRSGAVETVLLKSRTMNFNEALGKAYAIDLIGNQLIVRDDQVDTKLTIFDLDSDAKKPVYTGYVGQGPGELTNPGPMIMDAHQFLLYDGSKMKLLSFQLDSLKIPNYKPQEAVSVKESGIIDIKKISKDMFLAVGVFPENRFLLINIRGETVGRLGTYPIALTGDMPEYVRAIAAQSMLTTNLEKNRSATAMRYGEHIQFHAFNLSNTLSEAKLLNEHNAFLPEYTTKDYDGSANFKPTDKTRWGYLSLSSNADFVYALYSGKPQIPGTKFYQGNQVHVLDWTGRLVKKIELDKEAISITCNQSELYSLLEGENGYEIVKYKL